MGARDLAAGEIHSTGPLSPVEVASSVQELFSIPKDSAGIVGDPPTQLDRESLSSMSCRALKRRFWSVAPFWADNIRIGLCVLA
jgi:hypothetical protein